MCSMYEQLIDEFPFGPTGLARAVSRFLFSNQTSEEKTVHAR